MKCINQDRETVQTGDRMAIFGDGLDLNIACCGDINKSSYSNLGYSYELPDGIK